jgi:hypothetical protein
MSNTDKLMLTIDIKKFIAPKNSQKGYFRVIWDRFDYFVQLMQIIKELITKLFDWIGLGRVLRRVDGEPEDLDDDDDDDVDVAASCCSQRCVTFCCDAKCVTFCCEDGFSDNDDHARYLLLALSNTPMNINQLIRGSFTLHQPQMRFEWNNLVQLFPSAGHIEPLSQVRRANLMLKFCPLWSNVAHSRVVTSKKAKKAKFCHKQFKKAKSSNCFKKGQIRLIWPF